MKIKDILLSLRINKHILTGYSYDGNIILKWQIESCVIAPSAGDSKFDENSRNKVRRGSSLIVALDYKFAST
jgi:hypothetical protein